MTPQPKISIITPSYNQGHFLEESICSVIDQAYPNLEFFLMDGGSTDESLDVIKKYSDHFSFWVSEADNGQSDAINKGLQRATGDLVAWINADDYYLPDAFMKAAQAYQKNPQASFFFGDGLRVDEQGRTISQFFPTEGVRFHLPALINGLNYIMQPSTFINRSILERVGYLNPELHYGLDTDLWIRLAMESPPQPISKALAASREHGSSKTSTGSFKRFEELRQLAEKYSGKPLTPGAFLYFLNTVHRLAKDDEELYPPEYRIQLEAFWSATSNLLAQFQARQDGFPIPLDELAAREEPPLPPPTLFQRIIRRIRSL